MDLLSETTKKRFNHDIAWGLFFGILIGSTVTELVVSTPDWRIRRQLGLDYNSAVATPHNTVTVAPNDTDRAYSLELLNNYAEYQGDLRSERTIGTHNSSSPFKGPPTKEVDEAWSSYWKIWTFSVDEDAFKASKPQHIEEAVRIDPELVDGTYHDRYLATFEATHQLHCLYNLFRASYLDEYTDEKLDYDANPEEWHQRVDHCVDVLRQKLACDRDTSLITYNWVAGKKGPHANFNVQRVCHKWEHLDEWAAKYEVDTMPAKPEDAVQLKSFP